MMIILRGEYKIVALPCLIQSLAGPLVLGRGPNETSEQRPMEAEEVRATQSRPSFCQELLSQLWRESCGVMSTRCISHFAVVTLYEFCTMA